MRAPQLNTDSTPFIRRVDLTEQERRELRATASSVGREPYTDFEAFYAEIDARRPRISQRLRSALKAFRDADRGGAVLIDGVPVGDLPLTPDKPFTHAPILDLGTEALLALLATEVAEPFTFAEWDSGHMVQNKYPLRAHRDIQFGTNAVDFLVHSETPFREFCPDYLSLLCLRTDQGRTAQTLLCDIAEIIDAMSADHRATLARPLYAYSTDNPAIVVNGKGITRPMPIITTRGGKRVYEYTHDILAVNATAAEALSALKRTVEERTRAFLFEEGMLLIIDNSHMIHGRSSYEPLYDGHDRWLQRLLLSNRLFKQGEAVLDRRVPDRNLLNYPTEYQHVLRSLDVRAQ